MTEIATEHSPPASPATDRYAFKRAVRTQRWARIMLDGPPGAGTTYTALVLAEALGTKVAVIDGQRGRSSVYADDFAFDVSTLTTFSPDSLVTALAHCAAQRYDSVVVAPVSPFWTGPGGVHELVDRAAQRGSSGNFSGWREVRPAERRMMEALFGYPGHLLVTARDKLDYAVETSETGSKARRITALAPVAGSGMEYEFDIVATLDHTHTLTVLRAPHHDLSGAVEPEPGPAFGARIKDVLETGHPVEPAHDLAAEAAQPGLTFEQLGDLMARVRTRQAEGYPLLLNDGSAALLGAYIAKRGNELRRDR